LVVAPEPEPQLAAQVHVADAVREPIAHVVFEPVGAPEPEPVSEYAAAGPAAPAAPEPLVKPIVIGVTEAQVEKKRGWWRR
jgi:hypothetical protein